MWSGAGWDRRDPARVGASWGGRAGTVSWEGQAGRSLGQAGGRSSPDRNCRENGRERTSPNKSPGWEPSLPLTTAPARALFSSCCSTPLFCFLLTFPVPCSHSWLFIVAINNSKFGPESNRTWCCRNSEFHLCFLLLPSLCHCLPSPDSLSGSCPTSRCLDVLVRGRCPRWGHGRA